MARPVCASCVTIRVLSTRPSAFSLEARRWVTFRPYLTGYNGFYFCALMLILGFYVSLKIFRSPFGMSWSRSKANQTRMEYTGSNPGPICCLHS